MADSKLVPFDPQVATSEAVLNVLRSISQRVHVHSKRLARESGLTSPQLLCLKVLADADVDMTVAAVGRAVQLSSPTITGIVDRLERGGYAERVRDTVDRRRVFVRLTAQGAQCAKQLPHPLNHGFNGRFAQLPLEQRSAMLANLEQIAALMDIDRNADELPG